jgi:2-iminobutanoate/2-iminopropanoate deaminase
MIESLMVPGVPAPVAPFSHTTAVHGWVFVTGQMPTDPDDDNAPLPEGIEAQTRRAIANLRRVLTGIGRALYQEVFARFYLTHLERDYQAMNTVYQSYFTRPAAGTDLHWPHCARPRAHSSRLICWRTGKHVETADDPYAPLECCALLQNRHPWASPARSKASCHIFTPFRVFMAGVDQVKPGDDAGSG